MCDHCKEMAERIEALEARVAVLEQPSACFHQIKVSGTGDARIAEGVRQAIEASFDRYTHDFGAGEINA